MGFQANAEGKRVYRAVAENGVPRGRVRAAKVLTGGGQIRGRGRPVWIVHRILEGDSDAIEARASKDPKRVTAADCDIRVLGIFLEFDGFFGDEISLAQPVGNLLGAYCLRLEPDIKQLSTLIDARRLNVPRVVIPWARIGFGIESVIRLRDLCGARIDPLIGGEIVQITVILKNIISAVGQRRSSARTIKRGDWACEYVWREPDGHPPVIKRRFFQEWQK